jgi:hypothetical protein
LGHRPRLSTWALIFRTSMKCHSLKPLLCNYRTSQRHLGIPWYNSEKPSGRRKCGSGPSPRRPGTRGALGLGTCGFRAGLCVISLARIFFASKAKAQRPAWVCFLFHLARVFSALAARGAGAGPLLSVARHHPAPAMAMAMAHGPPPSCMVHIAYRILIANRAIYNRGDGSPFFYPLGCPPQ